MDEADIQPITRRCVSCGGHYLLEFFRPITRNKNYPAGETRFYRDRCIGCETLRKKKENAERRYRKKAKATLSRHAITLQTQGRIGSAKELQDLYGWSIDRMVKDIKQILNEGCPYCFQKLDEADQMLRNVTLDIIEPRNAPHYSTNVNWCCSRCNSEKRNMSVELWGARRSMWDRWRQIQILLEKNPEEYGFLFWKNEKVEQPTLWQYPPHRP